MSNLNSPARAVLGGLLAMALAACATIPRFEAAGDVHAFLVAIRDGDQAGFDAHVDRDALKAQLRSRLLAETAAAHGPQSWQAAGAYLAGPLVDLGVDAFVQPETFRAAAMRVGYSPDRPLPNRLQIDAFLKPLGDGEVCVVARSAGPCTLVFRDEAGTWRLVGYEGDIARLLRPRG